MAAHAAYDCSPFILMHALIRQQKCRDAHRLKCGETHLRYAHVCVHTSYLLINTHTHTYSPERGSLCVEPRGRGSVRSQAADSAFENLRMRGKRERVGGWTDEKEMGMKRNAERCRQYSSDLGFPRHKKKSELPKISDESDRVG